MDVTKESGVKGIIVKRIKMKVKVKGKLIQIKQKYGKNSKCN